MKHARWAAVILATVALAGCASVQQKTEGWWGELTGSGTTAPQGSVYYAATDGLVMHGAASGGAAIVGRLTQYQRVVRTELQNGWAYVTTDAGLAGWVDNAQLIWRLPAATGSGAATPAASESQPATAPAAPAAAPTSAPAAPAAATPVDAAPVPQPTPAPAAPAATVTPVGDAPPAASAMPAPEPQPTPQTNQPSPDMFDPF